ncbi:MAG: GAF domain-containing protein [Promethearchaeota archaeon]|jgi:hypothetical protein
MNEILSRTIKISGCQSNGIRLQKNGDYPFYVHEGYPNFFILKENTLLVRNRKKRYLIKENGRQVLDCMCGNVIRGHFDPTFPFFSKKGSFWTNGTTNMLSSITDKQEKFIGPTRNLCNLSGYESVALIPLITDGKTIGLVHLADPREHIFTEEKISEFELAAEEFANIIKRATEITEKLFRIDTMIQASKN